ncbi:MAG TPA: hypothetical protein VH414_04095 [Lichenihabitans sp.]|jgi:hypothetical protein|nr:hypothetical protein [Lichenihabitans sp.]
MSDFERQILINVAPLALFLVLYVFFYASWIRRRHDAGAVVVQNVEELRRLNRDVERLIELLERGRQDGDRTHG